MLDGYDEILTIEEVSEILKMGRGSIYVLLQKGKLKGLRNGRTWRIPKLAVQEFILGQAGL